MEQKGTTAAAATENKKRTRKPRDYECGLKLYYQPIMYPMFGRTVGYEALIRLVDKELSFLPPAVFIPIAEKTSLNAALGNWVFEESARFIKKLEKKQIQFEYISVNVSSKHFQKKDFTEDLMGILDKHQVGTSRFCLEISEPDLMEHGSQTMRKMHELKKRGFLIAIDDFGGGFSSLAKISSLPADILKLDKSFIDRIVIDPHMRDVTEAIINLADKLGLEVVAKGVEDMAQEKMLMQMGCQKMQGFYFNKPLKERDILYPKKQTGPGDAE